MEATAPGSTATSALNTKEFYCPHHKPQISSLILLPNEKRNKENMKIPRFFIGLAFFPENL